MYATAAAAAAAAVDRIAGAVGGYLTDTTRPPCRRQCVMRTTQTCLWRRPRTH